MSGSVSRTAGGGLAAERLRELAGDFAAAAAWLSAAADAADDGGTGPEFPPLPSLQLATPRGLGREEKLQWLAGVARRWGVVTVPDGRGGMKATKRFGALTITAVACDHDRSVFDRAERADDVEAGPAESPVAA